MPDPDPELLDAMRAALRGLPEPTRTIYRLHLLDELDYRAIADRLGIEIEKVELCIAEAIVLIDRALGD